MQKLNRAGTMVSLLLLMTLAVGRSAYAQIDLSGEWTGRAHEDQPHRAPGAFLGDYTGLPINDAARLKADSWDASIMAGPEHMCIPHPAMYSTRGPNNMLIQRITDPDTQALIGFTLYGLYYRQTRTIWMDGRPHPSRFAPHTAEGFSTGRFEGQMLTVDTSHIKIGWIQRNGVAASDQTTMTEHFIRNGDQLTVVTLVNDPIYLTEPFIRSTNWVFNPNQQLAGLTVNRCDVADEVAPRPRGYVPHYLPGEPGETDRLTQFAKQYALPQEAARGGAETTYPEYMVKLQQLLKQMQEAKGK